MASSILLSILAVLAIIPHSSTQQGCINLSTQRINDWSFQQFLQLHIVIYNTRP